MVDVKDIYWAAGFLEGEGCFYTSHNTKASPAITAPQVQREPLEKLQSLFGGSIQIMKRKPSVDANRKDIYRWNLYGPRAAGTMMTLYSLMSSRRKAKIHELLTAWKAAPNRQHKKIRSIEEARLASVW